MIVNKIPLNKWDRENADYPIQQCKKVLKGSVKLKKTIIVCISQNPKMIINYKQKGKERQRKNDTFVCYRGFFCGKMVNNSGAKRNLWVILGNVHVVIRNLCLVFVLKHLHCYFS